MRMFMRIAISEIGSCKGAMRSWDPGRVSSLLLRSAKIAERVFHTFKWERKGDTSLVTEADLEIERLFAKVCDRPEHGVRLIGEEGIDKKGEDYVRAALAGRCWIIDPIDGTAPFACNLPTWGISIAFADGGVIKNGAIFLPSTGELYISHRGRTYFSDNVRSGDKSVELRPLRRPAANFARGALVSISQDMAKRGRLDLDNPVQAVCCTVFSVSGLLRGRYAAYVGSMKLWDLAGAIPLLMNAGFSIRSVDGRRIGAEIEPDSCNVYDPDPAMRWRYAKNMVIAAEENAFKALKAQ